MNLRKWLSFRLTKATPESTSSLVAGSCNPRFFRPQGRRSGSVALFTCPAQQPEFGGAHRQHAGDLGPQPSGLVRRQRGDRPSILESLACRPDNKLEQPPSVTQSLASAGRALT